MTMAGAEQATAGSDHRKASRRRGDTLHAAIYEATLAELVEVGYAELTMQRIASRARASKGSLYRRWSSRAELVVDAVRQRAPVVLEVPETGSVRGDVLGFLRGVADVLNGPAGEAVRGLMIEAMGDPELRAVIRARFIEPATECMLEALRRGVVRGEVRPAALTPLVAGAPIAVLREQFLLGGVSLQDSLLVEVVDTIVVPLTQAHEG
jgi:AcrR family transcriptional regulator